MLMRNANAAYERKNSADVGIVDARYIKVQDDREVVFNKL